MRRIIILLLGILLLTTQKTYAFPIQSGNINDFSHVFSPKTIFELEQVTNTYQEKKKRTIVVVTIPTTDSESLENYSQHIIENWNLKNEILIVIAAQDRHMHISIAPELKGNLKVLNANNIVLHTLQPSFREGKYDEGIKKGVTNIMQNIDNNKASRSSASIESTLGVFFIVSVVAAFLLFFVMLKPLSRLS